MSRDSTCCVSSQKIQSNQYKQTTFFLHLVTSICRQEKVSIGQAGRILQPSKFLILESSVEYLIENWKRKRAIKTKTHQGNNLLSDLEWIMRWMQRVRLIFEDYARKNGLKLPLFLTVKYEVTVESSKVKKERELEKDEDLEEDPEEELKDKQCKVDKASNPTSD
ncbi:hypothetical protein J1N35_041440 [Gossypium stocksii]|uniref:Uncharacterized protein n=1 Tax=Gossypium stocksii TaxID=47602 RepID=A0A9D3UFU7_9ROSI|nr:hypothetical protein J1N35_041440 [Gossypium stocksii]